MTGGNSPVSTLPYILDTDTMVANDPNIWSHGLTTALDHIIVPNYATTTARDAANTVPVQGDLCYVVGGTTRGYYCYSGSSWIGPTQFDQGFQAWSPVWSTSTGSHTPTIGNGTLTGQYMQLGKVVLIEFLFIAGSTTNYNGGTGSDNWEFTLPVQANTTLNLGLQQVGNFNAGQSGSALLSCSFHLVDTTHFALNITSERVDGTAGTGGLVDAVSPWTWASANTNNITGSGWYIAS